LGGDVPRLKFVLKPTVAQSRRLEALLAAQCELYNSALEERRGAWRWEQRRVTRFEQFGRLAGLREVRPEVMAFGVTVARGTLTRLDRAFAAFFRRLKAGQKPGYPRFRSRFDSVSWPDRSGWALDAERRRFYVQGVGQIKVPLHRKLSGVPKTATLRREGRRWVCVIFCADVLVPRLQGVPREQIQDLLVGRVAKQVADNTDVAHAYDFRDLEALVRTAPRRRVDLFTAVAADGRAGDSPGEGHGVSLDSVGSGTPCTTHPSSARPTPPR